MKASQRARHSPEGAVRGTDAQEAPRTATGISLFILHHKTTSYFILQTAFTYLIDSDTMFGWTEKWLNSDLKPVIIT